MNDVPLKFYETARAEMLLRIREREVATYVWLGVIGTIVSLAFGTGRREFDVLLVLPVVSLGFAARVTQHEELIKVLAAYCKNEVGPLLESQGLRQWDNSRTLAEAQSSFVATRTLVNLLLFVGPSSLALWLNSSNLAAQGLIFRTTFWVGVFCTALESWLLVRSLVIRLKGTGGRDSSGNNTRCDGDPEPDPSKEKRDGDDL